MRIPKPPEPGAAIYVNRRPGGKAFSVEIFGEHFGLTREQLRELKDEIDREIRKRKP